MKKWRSTLTVVFVALLLLAVAVTKVSAQTKEELAARGYAIATHDRVLAQVRLDGLTNGSATDGYWLLGFDIATAIFGDPALGGQGNTAVGPGSLKYRNALSASGQKGFDDSVKFHLSRHYKRTPGEVAATDKKNSERISAITDRNNVATGPAINELRCRGGFTSGYSGSAFETVGSRVSSSGESILTVSLKFWETARFTERVTGSYGVVLSEPHWEFPSTGCTWLNSSEQAPYGRERDPYRPLRADEPKEIRFETPANAQLKQQLHGSPLDTSPTAAERFPDAQTIPEYLKDPNHYWSFFVVNTNQGYFQATGHKYWKPDPVKAVGRVKTGEPTGPPRPICDVAQEARARNSPAAPGLEEKCRADLASKGEAIAKQDPIVANARAAEPDALYREGFDIATGIFGDPALGAKGNTAMGPGSQRIRDSLRAAGQRGFDAAVKLHLSRNYKR